MTDQTRNRHYVFGLATPNDVPPLVELIESAYRGPSSRIGWTTEADLLDGQRTDVEELSGILANDQSRLIVATDRRGALTGCCQLERRSDTLGYFGTFAVRPVAQGTGLGGLLLKHAESMAVSTWNLISLEMTVIAQRSDLIGWYRRRGYHETGETRPFPYGEVRFGSPRRDDLHFVVLTKQIGPGST